MPRSWSSDVPPTYPQETTLALLAISVALWKQHSPSKVPQFQRCGQEWRLGPVDITPQQISAGARDYCYRGKAGQTDCPLWSAQNTSAFFQRRDRRKSTCSLIQPGSPLTTEARKQQTLPVKGRKVSICSLTDQTVSVTTIALGHGRVTATTDDLKATGGGHVRAQKLGFHMILTYHEIVSVFWLQIIS